MPEKSTDFLLHRRSACGGDGDAWRFLFRSFEGTAEALCFLAGVIGLLLQCVPSLLAAQVFEFGALGFLLGAFGFNALFFISFRLLEAEKFSGEFGGVFPLGGECGFRCLECVFPLYGGGDGEGYAELDETNDGTDGTDDAEHGPP